MADLSFISGRAPEDKLPNAVKGGAGIPCDGASSVLDTDGGGIPGASGNEQGTMDMRGTKAVQSDKLEY